MRPKACHGRKKLSFSEKIAKEYNLLLNDFSALNVREKSASVLLERVLNKKVVVGLDPTLLLEKDDWDKIAIEPKVKDYIFVYQLSPSRYMTDIIKKLKQKTGLKVVAVPFVMGTVNAYCDMTAGPSEWIGYIKNADYVVTDSFHATVFSIIYKKKLYSCANESASRIVDLLKEIQAEEFLFNGKREFELVENIDFTKIFKIIFVEKKRNILDISNMISKGKKND